MSQSLSDTSGWLKESLSHLRRVNRGSQTPQDGSYRFSDASGWLTEALKTHQGGLQRLLDTLQWLTEALRHLKVAQSLSDTSGWLKESQTPQGG